RSSRWRSGSSCSAAGRGRSEAAQRFVAKPDFSALGGSRPALAFGWGESIGSTCVVGVALPSSAGIGGSARVFGFGAASGETLAAP
ncbi:hypothetical protein, partial [Klebsiella pneumoniae]|uniref:hypothetical protein n=1 Tax=Klebsiella pneumoniae TaxID=573 RepID=UPI00376ED75A